MKPILISAFLCCCLYGSAQNFTTKVGIGIGDKFERDFPGCKSPGGRIMLSLSQFYNVTENHSIGLQAIASGKLTSILGGASGSCETYEASTNTTTIGNNNLNASSYLIRNRYRLKNSEATFYADLGVGVTNYYYGAITQEKGRATKISFAISPQIGFQFSRLDFSCMMILGGRTPAFEGYDSFSARNVSISSIRSQQLYVTLTVDAFRF